MNLQDRTRVRELNDAFRMSFVGGTVLLTAGIQSLSAEMQARALSRVRSFDAFNPDNDPHQEHDFGSFKVDGQTYFWKLDYYDRHVEWASEVPHDPEQTTRVLTIMLAEEY